MFSNLTDSIANNLHSFGFLAIPVCFFAGIISSLSPCGITALPIIAAYSAKEKTISKKKIILLFSIGFAISFILLAIFAAKIGVFIQSYLSYAYLILSIVIIVSAITMFDFSDNKNTCKIPLYPTRLDGIFDVIIIGALTAVISSPCAAPVLITILSFITISKSVTIGILSLISYAIGMMTIAILLALGVGKFEKFIYSKKSKLLKNILAVIILLFGLYLFYLGI